MKKTLALVLCIVLILGILAGCGGKSGKPDNMSEAYYQFGLRVLEITDNYLSMKTDARTAYNSIDDLKENADLPESFGSDTYADSVVETSVSLLTVRLNAGDYDGILETRNSLAEKLNEPAFGK